SFVKEEENRTLLLSSDIIYGTVSDLLADVSDQLVIPEVAIESAVSDYHGYIKRSEIEAVLTAFSGIAEEIDAQGLTFNEVLESDDLMGDLFPVILSYVKNETNRNSLLASDILYYTFSNTILDIEALEVPDHALSDEVGYENWILRNELSVLLEAISILDIGLPAEGESFDISSVETEDLVQVIELESIILTRLITTQLNNANIMDIPAKAYTNEDRTDLL